MATFKAGPRTATLGSQMAKKLTFKVALFGALGAGSLAYAFLRRPRYLYDGKVQACAGEPPVIGLDTDCTALFMDRGNGTGKIYAPFSGNVNSVVPIKVGKIQVVIRSDSEPVGFRITLDHGSAVAQAGTQIKAGDLIGQAERVKVNAFRDEGGKLSPMAPSTWLVANALTPAKMRGDKWCEDSYNLVVPDCDGVTFRAPALPRWSFRTVRMSM